MNRSNNNNNNIHNHEQPAAEEVPPNVLPRDEEDSSEDDDEDDSSEDDSSVEGDIPTPEEVTVEYTYPQDFQGRRWQEIVNRGQFFRLIIDPSCTGIPTEQFGRCKYLIEIVYPEGKNSKLLRIGYYAFERCCNLQRMNPFPDRLVELDRHAFSDCCSLQGRITFPPSIRYVRYSCFSDCKAITSVVFESSTATNTTVVQLEDGIFADCGGLFSARLPNNLTVIPGGCFYGCHSLIDVPIPGTVRTIRVQAFAFCALSAVDLPEGVIAIAREAYRGCSVLVSVTIRSSTNAVQVGRAVFGFCPLLSIIKMYPWHFPKIFEAMNEDSSFIYKFFHQYHHQILDEEAEVGMVTRQHRNGRRRRRQRHPQKKQRLLG